MTHPRNHLLSTAVMAALAAMLTSCAGTGGSKGAAPAAPAPSPPAATPGVDSGLGVFVPPSVAAEAAPATFADPNLAQMHQLINSAGAIGAGKIGTGVTIGFMDSGVDRNHPSLSTRVTKNFVHVGATNDLTVDDKVGHGTVVATLAAGKPAAANYLNSDNTVARTSTWPGGVAQGATIVSSRIISDAPPKDDGSGQGNQISAGQGIGSDFTFLHSELANAGAKIINNSWGGLYWSDPALTTELINAYSDFIVTRGGMIVFANGNAGRDARYRPNPSDNASLPAMSPAGSAIEKGWLTVGALDPKNPTALTDYSQACGRAKNFCLVAPGNVVITEKYDGTGQLGLYTGGGTSFAAPQVAGAAAVVWAQFPYFNNDLVRQTILGTAKDIGAAGVDDLFGWGLLDVTKAANGPGNFAWGDVTVNFSGQSAWRNNIVGAGGLVKQGDGTLSLTASQSYTGDTRVQGGALDVRQGLGGSALDVSAGARVFASGTFGKGVSNNGFFINGRDAGATITGNYAQVAGGNLGLWLGTPLQVGGSATLAGQVTVLGNRTGYTAQSTETLLNATGGVSGKFDKLASAPGVLLEGTLAYGTNSVSLNISRLNVTSAAVGMDMGSVALGTAGRVEGAMQAIDGQLASGSGFIGSGFIDGAGALQRSPTAAIAERSLASLSGQMHAASAAMTFESLDAGRRAIDQRVAALSKDGLLKCAWTQDLQRNGNLAQSGAAGLGFDVTGSMSGYDLRLSPNAVAGLAVSQTQLTGWLAALGDRSQGRQSEAQVYAGWSKNGWFATANLGAGRYTRRTQRNVFLGLQGEGVDALNTGNYGFAGLQGGYRFNVAGAQLTPYIGSQYAQIRNSGFSEVDTLGFGLRAHDWNSRRWQGYAGLQMSRDWTLANGWTLGLEGRGEYQQMLAGSNGLQASFTGVDQWMPVLGLGLAQRAQQYGLGMKLGLSRSATFRFDLSRRSSTLGDANSAMLRFDRSF